MCSPLAVAGLALSAAGTGVGILGQKKSLDAQDDAIAAEAMRQQRMDEDANAAFQQALSKMGAEQQTANLDTSEQQRTARISEALEKAEAPVARQNIEQGAPKVISNEVDKASNESRRYAGALANRSGILNAGNDLTLGNRLALSNAANRVNTVANFKAGSAGVHPIELAEARTKGGTLRGIGDILNAAGMVTGMAALAKAPTTAAMKAAEASRAQALAAKAAASGSMHGAALPGAGSSLFLRGGGISPLFSSTTGRPF